jgi:hypothetical protein
MHNNDTTLAFLKEKIEEIRIALFKAEINSELQLPNNIISTLKVDEEGYIWFYTSCNGSYATQVDKEFFAYLDYYQKGRDSRLRVNGRASIIDGCGSDADTTIGNSSLILLKMKIMQAEYFGHDIEKQQTWMDRIKTTFTDLLAGPSPIKKYLFS